ncbi:DGQHR domain-containing protein [Qipengyuania sp. S6317L1]|uniref:DGQHR domain-containing protein n=1 Tax=Qipengyuania sp. S6317L1 TaxID=2926410 RepID=UPI001FF4D6A1|nr:DGQHR domain-containing protein [Qipengyuania sp. S6317L1]MCK0099254.1 DGQHR domain-containing protein [Qipengyuania sp. S6317L1]
MASRTKLSLPFQEVEQPVGKFYSTVMPAQSLLEICQFDFRQIKENNGVKDFMGIQRKLKDDRVKEIRKYIGTVDASFPTSIVVSVDERCASLETVDGLKHLVLTPYEDPEDKSVIVPFRGIARIIDGQHRLKAFEGTNFNWDLSVNIFVGIAEGTQAMLFSKVNLAQTKVNKSLVYDLFSLDKGRSPEKTCHELVVSLNSRSDSPFFERIKRLGSATEGVFGETLSQATVVRGILPYVSRDPMTDRDIGKRTGVWPDRGQDDFERRIFYPHFKANEDHKILAILINFFGAVSEKWEVAWTDTGRGAMLSKTNGYNALIRYLREAYLSITTKPTVPTKEQFRSLLDRSSLKDNDFNTDRFVPGSSGAAALYRELAETLPKEV